jgi:5-(carboxyamino)imidazole ribonucleotide mutase
MPGGVPVATMSIGKPGAINAAIYAAKILSLSDENIEHSLNKWIFKQTSNVPVTPKKNND